MARSSGSRFSNVPRSHEVSGSSSSEVWTPEFSGGYLRFVSGAGDTVIGAYTLAVAAGADPIEAAMLANHAAGVVVGKLGTATVTPKELLASI